MSNIDRDDVVIDVGCGQGYFLPTLAAYSNNVVGLDMWKGVLASHAWYERVVGWPAVNIVKELIDTELGQSNNTELVQADGFALPFKDNSIDLLFCLDMLEHVTAPVDHLLMEFRRVLKDEGIFISSLPNERGWALVLRQAFSKVVGISRDRYSIRELIRAFFSGKVPTEAERSGSHHKGYDYREDIRRIGKYFKIQKISHVPIGFLLGVNPTIIVKAVKR